MTFCYYSNHKHSRGREVEGSVTQGGEGRNVHGFRVHLDIVLRPFA
jgi:hypothetical protein